MLTSIRNVKLYKMRKFVMFITAVCILFLIIGKKSVYSISIKGSRTSIMYSIKRNLSQNSETEIQRNFKFLFLIFCLSANYLFLKKYIRHDKIGISIFIEKLKTEVVF